MKRNLTLKNMMIDYATADSHSDMEYTWLMFYTMHALGYIADSTWLKFFNECSHWYFDSTLSAVCTYGKFDEVITITPEYIDSLH